MDEERKALVDELVKAHEKRRKIEDAELIATLEYRHAIQRIYEHDNGPIHCDKAMASAAPELLAALELVAASSGMSDRMFNEVMGPVDAAIAKAKGQA